VRSTERATKISKGEYLYRGFRVYCFGYYEPEHRVVWEAVEESTGDGVAHGYSKRAVMNEIDYFMDRE
jgi:hypothetical protein